jgi:hypothetical protein
LPQIATKINNLTFDFFLKSINSLLVVKKHWLALLKTHHCAVPPWGGCNPQQIDDLQATGHIQNGREQIYLHLSTAISAVNNLV